MQKVEQILFSTLSRTASDDIFLQDVSKKVKKKEINSKKFVGCFKYEVPFKYEWKVNFPIKDLYSDKYKFKIFPAKINLLEPK